MTARKVIIVGLVVLMLESLGGYIYLTYRQDQVISEETTLHTESSPQASASPAPRKAILSMQSDSTSVTTGEVFKVDFLLNTFSYPVSAADVVVQYDPAMLSPQASGSAKPFEPSEIFQRTVFNEVNSKQGIATMSAVAETGKDFSGSDILTSLHFKALKSGSAELTIVFTPGETRDTNIVSETEDILDTAQGLSISILP